MATKYWVGKAVAVAQISTATPATVETNDIFRLIVGGLTIATFTATAGTVANVTAGLTAAWNASTHPYATGITASDQTTHVKLLADVAGVPFTVTSSTTNGGAADTQTLAMATTTANAGPNAFATAANWSDAVVPVNTDTVVAENSSISILWDLDQSGVTLAELRVMKSYTGNIGLNPDGFATSATAIDTSASEYRDTRLKISSTTIRLGEHYGDGSPVGSQRIRLNTGSVQTQVNLHGSADSGSDGNREPVQWIGTHASNVLNVTKGKVGIAVSAAGEVATVATLNVSHSGNVNSDARVNIGPSVTLATVNQSGGDVLMGCGCTTYEQRAGTMTTSGSGAITTANVGGMADMRSSGTINTLRVINGGSANFSKDPRAKTVTNCEVNAGGAINIDNGVPLSITFTNGIDLIRLGLDGIVKTWPNINLAITAA